MKSSVAILLVGLLCTSTVYSKASELDSSDLLSGKYSAFGFSCHIPALTNGVLAFSLNRRDIGFFVHAWSSFPLGEGITEYYSDITPLQVSQWGDQLLEVDDRWFSINVGITHVLTRYVGVYFGTGYSHVDQYELRFDPTRELGLYGEYWIQADSRSMLSASAGLIILLTSRFGMLIGTDIEPSGVTLGFYSFI
ncbi:MAG: hypothetical protein GY835_05570 [bacterium]|nr:hypothetical protein [bacterium]